MKMLSIKYIVLHFILLRENDKQLTFDFLPFVHFFVSKENFMLKFKIVNAKGKDVLGT